MSAVEGIITSGVGGLYTVTPTDGRTAVTCTARGVFRHSFGKPLVGDHVSVRLSDTAEGSAVITEIHPRRTEFIRPPMANITHLYCVFAATHPAPSTETVDKLLAVCVHQGVHPAVVITKGDLDSSECEKYRSIYTLAGFDVYTVRTDEPDTYGELRRSVDCLPGESIAVFAGASGVGKSTLLNHLFPELGLATGEISRRIQRGRHTTRAVTLYTLGGRARRFVADTPGFSLLDFARFGFFELPDLFDSFPDLAPHAEGCRYTDCTHTGEDDTQCGVAKAVAEGRVASSRHDSYRSLYKILKEKQSDYTRR